MVANGQDEFDDLDVAESYDRRRSGGGRSGRRSVITDDSYGPGGYLGRDEDGRDAEPPRSAARRPSSGRKPAAVFDDTGRGRGGARAEPDIDFDAVQRRARRGEPREEPAAEPPTRGAQSARPPAGARKTGRGRAEQPAPERGRTSARAEPMRDRAADGPGGVWAVAFLASVLWVGGVLAFAIGFYRLPTAPVADLFSAASRLEPRFMLMIGAIALAPLGVIWTAALTARRARFVAVEARRVSEIGARLASGGGGAGAAAGGGLDAADADALRADVERARAAVDALSSSLRDAEARAEDAQRRLEKDQQALTGLLSDIAGEADRLARAAETMQSSGGAPEPEALAAAVADALSDRLPVAGAAAAASYGAAPAPAAAGRAAYADDAPSAPPRSAVMRAADAAAASLGRGEFDDADDVPGYGAADYAQPGYGDAAGRSAAQDGLEDGDEAFDPEFDGDLDDIAHEPGAAETLDWPQFVRAANFPESEEDRETLDALYKVIKDPEVAALLQAAEDVLSALADIDLFMDDMQPHHAPAERWRAYIVEGDARDALDLGGVRDTHAIEDAVSAIRERQGFDDTSEQFLNRYEAMLERLFREAPSGKLAVELADTRTGRAFMLLARASGRLG